MLPHSGGRALEFQRRPASPVRQIFMRFNVHSTNVVATLTPTYGDPWTYGPGWCLPGFLHRGNAVGLLGIEDTTQRSSWLVVTVFLPYMKSYGGCSRLLISWSWSTSMRKLSRVGKLRSTTSIHNSSSKTLEDLAGLNLGCLPTCSPGLVNRFPAASLKAP